MACLGAALFTPVTQVHAEAADGEGLVVQVGGFAHPRGQAVAALFRPGDDIFGKSYRRLAKAIDQGKASFMFSHLVPGDYAVIVFHDENGNDQLEHNLLHLPAEPIGFSNGFRLTVFSGLPNFDKLRFAVGALARPVEITVH
jgi:uncharacterized protein (DUF2141 family)